MGNGPLVDDGPVGDSRMMTVCFWFVCRDLTVHGCIKRCYFNLLLHEGGYLRKKMLSLDGEFWVSPGSNSTLEPVEISKLEALAELGGAELQRWGRNRQIHTGNVD